MVRLNVNPTRMELTRLKARLAMSRRGHKLLKDKRDELMKQFLTIVRENMALRKKVEEALLRARADMDIASAVMNAEMMEQALLYPRQRVELDYHLKNIMSVNVPVYKYRMATEDSADIFPYGFAGTPGQLDMAVAELAAVLPDLMALTTVEKSVQLLAAEIEKTRRRVNGLEYMIIPQLEETIRYINMKLDENERSSQIRAMKVKDMILRQAHHYES